MQNLVRFHQFALKILSGNEIPTSIKGHDSLVIFRKFKHNNPNIDVVYINAYATFGQITSICSQNIFKILSGNEILTSIKGHNSVINSSKLK